MSQGLSDAPNHQHPTPSPGGEGTGAGISVALCTYNGAAFLGQQLCSIAAQSRAVDELIICDDGSTDATRQIVNDFARGVAFPVYFYPNPCRLGVTKNFEQAITRCTGEIIFLADQDDVWHPHKVARLAAALVDPAVGLAFSDAEIVRDDLSATGDRLWQSIWFDAAEQQRVASGDAVPVLLRHAVAAGTTLAFKSNYRPLLLPIPDFPHSHDIWITLLIAAVARIAPVDEPLIRYRLHGNNHVGMRRLGWLGQWRMARQQVQTGTFAYLADFTQAAADRLARAPEVSPAVKAVLESKILHSRWRDRLARSWVRRLRGVAAEWWTGEYGRFSYGWKSVLQDLFLR